MKIHSVVVLFALGVLFAAPAGADIFGENFERLHSPPPAPPATPDAEFDATLDFFASAEQLGNADYATRDAANRTLFEYGTSLGYPQSMREAVLTRLRALETSPSLEAARRATVLIRRIEAEPESELEREARRLGYFDR